MDNKVLVTIRAVIPTNSQEWVQQKMFELFGDSFNTEVTAVPSPNWEEIYDGYVR